LKAISKPFMKTLDDNELLALAQQLGDLLKEKGLLLVTAESCTGGWIGQMVTAVPGSSAWYDRGFITYSNLAKQQMLSVQSETLAQHGAVSEQTVREMAQGAIKMSQAQVSVAVTGIAGPAGGSEEKPVGTVCFAWVLKNQFVFCKTYLFNGDRAAIRRQSVEMGLQNTLELLKSAPPQLA
jgi:nicotinamide-nucleotide amidase